MKEWKTINSKFIFTGQTKKVQGEEEMLKEKNRKNNLKQMLCAILFLLITVTQVADPAFVQAQEALPSISDNNSASGSEETQRQGWYSGKYTYYYDENGCPVTGSKIIEGVKYRFNKKGRLVGSGPVFSLNSKCAILVEADTGKVIYSKNPDLRHANASTTKIMTAILAVENSKMSEIVKTSRYAASQEPTKLYFKKGERFYMRDMLYSLLLPSHNDTAVAIAEHIGGNVQSFVNMMNEKAISLGCNNTHFATPNGLDAGLNHYTTARDMAKIASYAWQSSQIRKVVKTRTRIIKNLKGKRYKLISTNRLLNERMAGVSGMKTGYTNKAGQCFVGVVKGLNGKTYISVTFGARTTDGRWADARKLLSYARNLK